MPIVINGKTYEETPTVNPRATTMDTKDLELMVLDLHARVTKLESEKTASTNQ